MSPLQKPTRGFAVFFLAAISAVAQTNFFSATNLPPQHQTNSPFAAFQQAEQVRANCLAGRRRICGKILKVLPDGLVVESGYTDLLRPPLTDSWLVPGTVTAVRTANLIESSEPASVCVGTIFLTDLPKARGKKAKPYDYVILIGYPAGMHTYTSLGTITRTVRRFTGTLGAAVKLNLLAAEKSADSQPATGK